MVSSALGAPPSVRKTSGVVMLMLAVLATKTSVLPILSCSSSPEPVPGRPKPPFESMRGNTMLPKGMAGPDVMPWKRVKYSRPRSLVAASSSVLAISLRLRPRSA
ncbi:hypothetical protein D3C72_917270 [compost metagenome]